MLAKLSRCLRPPSKAVWEWTDSVWGKQSPHVRFRPIPNAPSVIPKAERFKVRDFTREEKRQIHGRDGYYCRFCHIPVIRSEIRTKIRIAYPAVVPWGLTNDLQHAAFQAMWAQYDHVIPHSRGGDNSLENIVLTCSACNYGRMSYTLDEVGLLDPRDLEPRRGTWDGLERFRP
jgi:HNH endonuclease